MTGFPILPHKYLHSVDESIARIALCSTLLRVPSALGWTGVGVEPQWIPLSKGVHTNLETPLYTVYKSTRVYRLSLEITIAMFF